jgi:hypothetical protein
MGITAFISDESQQRIEGFLAGPGAYASASRPQGRAFLPFAHLKNQDMAARGMAIFEARRAEHEAELAAGIRAGELEIADGVVRTRSARAEAPAAPRNLLRELAQAAPVAPTSAQTCASEDVRARLQAKGFSVGEIDRAIAFEANGRGTAPTPIPSPAPSPRPAARKAPSGAVPAEVRARLQAKGFSDAEINAAAALPTISATEED